jgi:integrase
VTERAPDELHFGKIYKVLDKAGRRYYRAAVEMPRDPATGKRRRKTVTRRTRIGVSRAIDAMRRDEEPKPEAPAPTLRGWLGSWIEQHAHSIRESTTVSYRALAKRIPPKLADSVVTAVTSRDLELLYAALLADGAAPNTVLHLHRLLHVALHRAEREGVVRRSVADLADAPRVPRHEVKTLATEQIIVLLQAAEGDPLEALYVLAVSSGMRLGELLALRWRDIDWDAAVVTVSGSIRRLPSDGLQRRETKSGRERHVPIPPAAIEALQAHRRRQAETRQRALRWADEDIVFAQPDGTLLPEYAFRRNSWLPLLERSGLPHITFHAATRHGSASVLGAAGVRMRVIADRLGHSDTTTTQRIYEHLMPGAHDAAVEAMERLLRVARG